MFTQVVWESRANFSIGGAWCRKGPARGSCWGRPTCDGTCLLPPCSPTVQAGQESTAEPSRPPAPSPCLLAHVSLVAPGASPRRRDRVWWSLFHQCREVGLALALWQMPKAGAAGGWGPWEWSSRSSSLVSRWLGFRLPTHPAWACCLGRRLSLSCPKARAVRK